jgi:hypothetical protein
MTTHETAPVPIASPQTSSVAGPILSSASTGTIVVLGYD